MNISSAIIKVAQGRLGCVHMLVDKVKSCEVHACENSKIAVTIEGESIDNEIAVVKQLETIPGVLSVEIVYSYSENELEKERNKIEMGADFPEWLNDENISASDIRYHGNLRKNI